jgi:hypothetical protein
MVVLCLPILSIAKKPRMFCALIATYNLVSLVFLHFLVTFLGDALSLYTNSKSYQIQQMSSFLCRFPLFMSAVGENASPYLSALFAIERLAVIRYPLKAYMLTFKRTVLGVVVITLEETAVASILFFVYGPIPERDTACDQLPDQAILLGVAFLITVIVPNFSLPVLAILAFRALKKQIAAVAQKVSGAASRATVVGMKTTKVFLTIAAVRCIIYSTYAFASLLFACAPYGAVKRVANSLPADLAVLIGSISFLDSLVYTLLMSDFRERLWMMSTCRSWWKAD